MPESGKINFRKLLDGYIYETTNNSDLDICSTNPLNLITYNRLDIGFKLLYLSLRKKNYKLAKEIYLDHIKSFSFGTFKEKGNANKKKT